MDALANPVFDEGMNRTATTPTTLVLGGTGKTGRRLARRLDALDRPVRIGSRRGTPPFDWNDPATWAPALAGCGAVYVAYQPDLAFPGAAEQVAGLVAAAEAGDVRRVVLLSGRNEDGALTAEAAVRASRLDWTIVRSSFFNQNFDEGFFVEPIRAGLLAFAAGAVAEPFIDADDIADVAVTAFTDDRHIGELYEVTGPRLLTFADAMDEISTAIGRQVRYVPISSADLAEGLRADGLPEAVIAAYTELFGEILDGRSAYLADGVERALGRAARDFRDFARSAAATGVWSAPVAEPVR